MSHPLVSVGLPVYNGEDYLDEALISLRRQRYPNLEIVAVDNASRDATLQILRRHANEDSRIRIHRNPATIPAEANFNKSLEVARGELFMWAAHDDLWEPEFMSELEQLLQRRPDAVLAFSLSNALSPDGAPRHSYPRVAEICSQNRLQRLTRFIRQSDRHGKANLTYGLIRTEVLRQAGGLKVWGDNRWGFDFLSVFRILTFGDVALSPNLLFHKRDLPQDYLPLPKGTFLKRTAHVVKTKHGYFRGYLRIIQLIENLSPRERLRLQAVVWSQICYLYLRELPRIRR